MSTINSVTFNAGSAGVASVYSPGDPILATVDYVPDAPTVTPSVFTLTTTITNSGGTVTATNSSPFTVDTPTGAGAGDVVAVSDTGSRTWTAGTAASDGSGGETQAFSSVA